LKSPSSKKYRKLGAIYIQGNYVELSGKLKGGDDESDRDALKGHWILRI